MVPFAGCARSPWRGAGAGGDAVDGPHVPADSSGRLWRVSDHGDMVSGDSERGWG